MLKMPRMDYKACAAIQMTPLASTVFFSLDLVMCVPSHHRPPFYFNREQTTPAAYQFVSQGSSSSQDDN